MKLFQTQCRFSEAFSYRSLISLVLLAILLCTLAIPAQASVKASADRTVLSINDVINLTINAENNSATPDFSPLEKDFEILSTRNAQQLNIINGNTRKLRQWQLVLAPRHSGELTIPPLTLGQEQTEAIHLVIHEKSQQAGVKDEVFVQLSLETAPPFYPQQQIKLSVKLFYRIPLQQGALSDPEVSGAIIQRVGKDSEYRSTQQGVSYNVIQRDYVLFAQQAGTLTIEPVKFEGSEELRGGGFSPFFNQPGRRFIKRSQSLSLDILAPPKSFDNKPWIPAKSLSITRDTGGSHTLQVGQALSITLRLKASGLTGAQLPDLPPLSAEETDKQQVKVYPDKPQTSSEFQLGDIQGFKEIKYALIPTEPGQLVLPAQEVQWWNTQTQSIETVHLAEKTFTVIPGEQLSTPLNKDSTQTVVSANEASSPATTDSAEKQQANNSDTKKPLFDNALLAGLLIIMTILWLGTLAVVWVLWRDNRQQPRPGNLAKGEDTAAETEQQAFKKLLTSCEQNDAKAILNHFNHWANHYLHQGKRFEDSYTLLSHFNDPTLTQLMEQLQEAQYGHASADIDTRVLVQQLKKLRQKKGRQQDKAVTPTLAPLNPPL